MSYFLEIMCLLIILETNQLIYGSTHALVGNFSELNPKDCGITRLTPNLDYNCFKWHKNTAPNFKGRNATEDEVPWIVLFTVVIPVYINSTFYGNRFAGCTGALIADNWALTAAHCLKSDDPKMYSIYTGINSWADPKNTYHVKAIRFIKHSDYKSVILDRYFYTLNDIGLIELDRSIKSIKPKKFWEQFNGLRSICLPQNNIFNAKKELALFGGWGMVDRAQWPLQVGIQLIFPSVDYSSVYSAFIMETNKLDNVTLTCTGDSGGPLWQYYNGRAVIIGVFSQGYADNTTNCEPQSFKETPNSFVRVSKYIDWIKNVTQLN